MTHSSSRPSPLEFAAGQISADVRATLHVVDKALIDLGLSPPSGAAAVAKARAQYLQSTDSRRRRGRLHIPFADQADIAAAQAAAVTAVQRAAEQQNNQMLALELQRLQRLLHATHLIDSAGCRS